MKGGRDESYLIFITVSDCLLSPCLKARRQKANQAFKFKTRHLNILGPSLSIAHVIGHL